MGSAEWEAPVLESVRERAEAQGLRAGEELHLTAQRKGR